MNIMANLSYLAKHVYNVFPLTVCREKKTLTNKQPDQGEPSDNQIWPTKVVVSQKYYSMIQCDPIQTNINGGDLTEQNQFQYIQDWNMLEHAMLCNYGVEALNKDGYILMK
jgi:hypothetical protein